MKNPNCLWYDKYNCPYSAECRKNFKGITILNLRHELKSVEIDVSKFWTTVKNYLSPDSIVWFNRSQTDSSINICYPAEKIETFFKKENREYE